MAIPHAAMLWMTIIIFTIKKDDPNYIDILRMRLKIDVPCGVGEGKGDWHQYCRPISNMSCRVTIYFMQTC